MKKFLLITLFLFNAAVSYTQTTIFKPVLTGDVTSGTDPFTNKAEAAAPADTQIVVNATHGFVMIHNGHSIGLVKTGLTGIDGTSGIKVSFTLTMDSSHNANGKAFNIELGNALTNSGSPNTAKDYALFNISSGSGTNSKSLNISGSDMAYQATPVAVTWYLNNTSAAVSYKGPDNNIFTLASNTWDVWVGNTIALSAQTGNSANPVNSFKVTANASGVQTAEFDNLEISTFSSTAPIQLNPLTASYQNNTVRLDWSTASEINSSVFQILRSSDGKTYSQIGNNMKAAGNSVALKYYTAYDASPLAGNNYYQIKEIDLDGKTTLSNIVTINNKEKIKVYPNPAAERITVEGASGTINIYDAAGRLVKTVTATSAKTETDIRALPAGIYFIKLNNTSVKLIKH